MLLQLHKQADVIQRHECNSGKYTKCLHTAVNNLNLGYLQLFKRKILCYCNAKRINMYSLGCQSDRAPVLFASGGIYFWSREQFEKDIEISQCKLTSRYRSVNSLFVYQQITLYSASDFSILVEHLFLLGGQINSEKRNELKVNHILRNYHLKWIYFNEIFVYVIIKSLYYSPLFKCVMLFDE